MNTLHKQSTEHAPKVDSLESTTIEKQHSLHPHHEHEYHTSHITQETDRRHEERRAHQHAIEAAPTVEEADFRRIREERSPAERRGPITKKELSREFQHTMKNIQKEMPPSQRAFSQFIHTPLIEKTSDFLGATIARPNALLAGSIGAFALTLGIYLFAKSIGYSLSGFEPIAAFFVGWLCGLFYDYLRIMITGKR